METKEKLWATTWIENQPEKTPIYGIVRSVSSSGMSRRIDFYAIDPTDNRPLWLTPVFRDLLGLTEPQNGRGVRVNGVGMDMIFHCVYNLGTVLHGNGYYFTSEQL